MKGNEKKKNVYLKYLRTISICAVAGGICGGLFTGTLAKSGLDRIAEGFMKWVRGNQIWIYMAIAAITVFLLESIMVKIRKIGAVIPELEDEACDAAEYEMEKSGTAGVIVSNVSNVIQILVLSTGYSLDYIKKADDTYLAAILIFMLACFYNGVWQLRYVRFVQKVYPDKKGDPSSMKFQKQWLESCDEAEKEMIYESSYKACQLMGRLIPFTLFAALMSHLLWNTGLMAIFVTGFLWITLSISYSGFAIRKRKQKLES